MKYLRNPLVPKRRAWVVGLTLSLLVLAGSTLLGNSQPPVASASGSATSSDGASLTPQIGSQAALDNNNEVDVIASWNCALPQGATPQFVEVTVQLSQQNGSATTSSSADYQNLQPMCNGVTDGAEVAVPSPTGGQPFQAGTADVSATVTLAYYDSSYYDLLMLTASVPDETITITSGTDTDLALTDMPADITTPATSSDGAVVDYPLPTTIDEDDSAPPVTCDTPSGSTFPIGMTTVTCTATDDDDTPSTVSASFTVTVTDLSLTDVPADITQPATSSDGAVVDYTPPTAVDEDGPAPDVTCDMPSGSTFPVGATTVTCSATDSDSTPSTVSASFTVTVTDTDLTLTNVPANIQVNTTSSAGAVVTYTPPTAMDEDGSAPPVTCDHPSGSTFPIGPTTVTCTATDPDDTPSTVSSQPFTVTVTLIVTGNDSDLALTNVPANIQVKTTSSAGAVVTYTPPTALDEDGSAPPVTCTPASGSTFKVGNTKVTCTTTDSDDTPSTVSKSFTVTVTLIVTGTDSDLALTNVPASITVKATSSAGAVVTYTPPTALDEDGSTPAVTCTPASGSIFKVGTTKVTCTTTDSDDTPKTVSASFTVTVTDTDLALTNIPSTITVNATTSAGAVVTYTPPTAVDEDGSKPAVTCTPASGSTFKVGTSKVTCTTTDPDDTPNSVKVTFQVVVNGPVQTGAMGMAFWLKKTSQAIISGGASTNGVCNAGTWLQQYAPFQDLSASATCSQVASYVTSVLNAASGTTAPLAAILKGQMVATALNVYFSDPTLGGNQLSAPAPIGGVTIDLTYICTAPATSGAPNCGGTYESTSNAFGGAPNLTISALLGTLSSQFSSGTWYGGDQTETGLASDALAAINSQWAFAP